MSIIKTKRKEKVAELEKNISGSKSLLVNSVVMDESFDSNENNLVGFVMMPELIKNNSIIFNFEHKDKGANMDSFIVTHISSKIFEVIDSFPIQLSDLVNLSPDSLKQSRIFLLQLSQELFNPRGVNVHMESHHLLNSSKVIGLSLPDLRFLEVFSTDSTNSLKTDSLTSLLSYSDISDISLTFLINSSSLASFNVRENACLATDDQLIQSNLPIFIFNLSGTDNVIVPMLDLQSHKNPYGFLGHQKAMPSECNYLYYVYAKDIFKSFGLDAGSDIILSKEVMIMVLLLNKNFTGAIDDARIYNYARTAEQIERDYNKGLVRIGG